MYIKCTHQFVALLLSSPIDLWLGLFLHIFIPTKFCLCCTHTHIHCAAAHIHWLSSHYEVCSWFLTLVRSRTWFLINLLIWKIPTKIPVWPSTKATKQLSCQIQHSPAAEVVNVYQFIFLLVQTSIYLKASTASPHSKLPYLYEKATYSLHTHTHDSIAKHTKYHATCGSKVQINDVRKQTSKKWLCFIPNHVYTISYLTRWV